MVGSADKATEGEALDLKHLERHPEPVEGCFGCKACTLVITVPRNMSWRNEDRQAEHMAAAKELMATNPERYAPATSRWV